jgi:hypothetical protein
MLPEYEKLGAFYLGRRTDGGGLLLYDSSHLVTHAVCVGMTGSGKTGLCIGLLEEAAIDGIPALVLDPKGDLANLLLTFPDLRAEDFAPWMNPGEDAAQQADTWRKGLEAWQQNGERIRRMRAAAEFAVYTPGSEAGIPVSILKSFAAPGPQILEDREALRDRVSATATSLLGLAGIQADPAQSREHVLISNLLDAAWRAGTDLDLAALIARIQDPPMHKVGVLDLESFYPARDRFTLAMALNNLLASPGFAAWLEGEPLDAGKLLWNDAGKPRISVFSIAHLSDAERMFFVSLLLNQTLSWMRSQSGSASVRALLYMDEVYGYLPPVANPPSKHPLMTLLKQARAFGLGVVLATQNPVDLDYKALANTGTWFLGRLQTERDKLRVLDGLEGAATQSGAGFDRASMDRLLAGLGKRVFLMHNVHEKHPVLFETRWTLSYLRGPMARAEIRRLMESLRRESPGGPDEKPVAVAVKAASAAAPVLGPDVPQVYFPVRGAAAVYAPVAAGAAQIHFLDPKAGVDVLQDAVWAAPISGDAMGVDWERAEKTDCALADLERSPEEGVAFAELPPAAARAASYAAWTRTFATWLFRTRKLELLRSPGLGEVSRPGESERDFRIRLQQAAHERRDELKAKLEARYGPKLQQLQQRRFQAVQRREAERQQSSAQMLSSVMTAGAGLLGALMGRKTFSAASVSRASQAVRAAGRAAKEYGDVGRATETIGRIDQQIAELNTRFEEELAALESRADPATEALETVTIRPRKSGITVRLVALGWQATRSPDPLPHYLARG